MGGSKLQHAMISDGPTAGVDKRKKNGFMKALDKIGNALRTHPTLDKRVAALEMAAEKGLVPKSLPGGDSWASYFWSEASTLDAERQDAIRKNLEEITKAEKK